MQTGVGGELIPRAIRYCSYREVVLPLKLAKDWGDGVQKEIPVDIIDNKAKVER